ncbi:MAG: DUF502 domain-containing protein [Chlamydiota bacterium]|nr:DUF502 domain-containing protein [Chlamydiota bacterium]
MMSVFSKQKKKSNLKHRLKAYFITGILVTLPVLGSAWLLSLVFVKLTNFIITQIPPHQADIKYVRILWRVVALCLLGSTLMLVGMIARNYLGGKLIRLGEGLLGRIPLFNKVYVTLKQISESIWGDNKRIFENVAMIEYPRKGIYSLCFITSEGRGEVQMKTDQEVVNVFLPTTPNPTSGFFLMIPRSDITLLDMSVEEGIKMIISGGVLTPVNSDGKKPNHSLPSHHEDQKTSSE